MTCNTQPITKLNMDPEGNLSVHSVFYTIQGEGPFCGQPAVFVRLWGCNLQCPSCDTDYTTTRESYTPGALVCLVNCEQDRPGTLVVITGGEPLRQNVEPFVEALLDAGHKVQIETNGTLPPPSHRFHELCSKDLDEPNACFIVCSPKTGKVNAQLFPLICAYKYVGQYMQLAEDDGLPILALDHTASPRVARPHEGYRGPVYLQPQDDQTTVSNRLNTSDCVASVLKFGHTLQIQTHKVIGVE